MKCWVNTEGVQLQTVARHDRSDVCGEISSKYCLHFSLSSGGKGSREEVSSVSLLKIDKNRFMLRSFDNERTHIISIIIGMGLFECCFVDFGVAERT